MTARVLTPLVTALLLAGSAAVPPPTAGWTPPARQAARWTPARLAYLHLLTHYHGPGGLPRVLAAARPVSSLTEEADAPRALALTDAVDPRCAPWRVALPLPEYAGEPWCWSPADDPDVVLARRAGSADVYAMPYIPDNDS